MDEILTHAGVGYARVALDELPGRLDTLRLLITVGEHALPDAVARRLHEWVEAGGGWLSVGGVCDAGRTLGARLAPSFRGWASGTPTIGEGYLVPESADHPVLGHVGKPLHFFNGTAVEADGATVLATMLDAHGRSNGRPLVLEHAVGRGQTLLVAADVTGTVVRVQQGVAVTRDGVPAPDGSAPVSDGVLKSGDGAVLDWIFDRDPVDGAPDLQAFLRPVADLWRELLLRGIFHLATKLDVPLPLLWLYPRNLPAIAHISHDTDGNEPHAARTLLDLLAAAEVRSTWCVILPGYERGLTRSIREAGHELAMHFDAMSDGTHWSEDEFHRQGAALHDLLGAPPVTNKNHYLRWEGDCELLHWCARLGIQIDQSKGASKTGEAGFNFGTCHPFFPVDPDGTPIDVLELPTPTQDLGVFAPEALLRPLLAAALKSHGVLHLLFHPAHVSKGEVAGAIARCAGAIREQGMEWWTAREINAWERARRRVAWSGYAFDGRSATARLRANDELKNATILWLARRGTDADVRRWDFGFTATVDTLAPGREHQVQQKAK
jgi:hypothetical protein